MLGTGRGCGLSRGFVACVDERVRSKSGISDGEKKTDIVKIHILQHCRHMVGLTLDYNLIGWRLGQQYNQLDSMKKVVNKDSISLLVSYRSE